MTLVRVEGQNKSTEVCSKLKRSVDMTRSGKNGLNFRTNASSKWDGTWCSEELILTLVRWPLDFVLSQ